MMNNPFKQSLAQKSPQIGLWLGLASAYSAELLAGTGFDWLLIDGEHAPNDVRSILAQLQAVAAYPVQPIVRPVLGQPAVIKQLLDIGAHTLLVPMVDTPEQAADIVAATRYPPQGIRGVGAALARASRWNQTPNYLHEACEAVCLLVQAETTLAMRNLDAIAHVDGVDGVFFGPSDLAASMGFLGQPNHPQVHAALLSGIERVGRAGKAAGILATDPTAAQQYLDAGALFVAVGVDTSLLVRSATQLAQAFRHESATEPSAKTSGY